jgi:hypothetical protein
MTDTVAPETNEDGTVSGDGESLLSQIQIVGENAAGSGGQRDPAFLPELALSNMKTHRIGIEVGDIKGEGFADAEPCGVEQPKQDAEGVGAERASGRQ